MNEDARRILHPGRLGQGSPEADGASTPSMDSAARLARIDRYLLSTLEAENEFLTRTLRDMTQRPALGTEIAIRNLRGRPHVVRLIESRAGDLVLGALQTMLRTLWSPVRHWKRRSAATLPVPDPPLVDQQAPANPEPHGPKLSDVDFDPAILDQRPRILIDITPTALNPGAKYGIARVARELALAAVQTGVALPVRIRNGKLYSYYEHPLLQDPVTVDDTTTFVIVDIFWYFLDGYRDIVRQLRARGTRIALVVHDIYPLKYPTLFPGEVEPMFEAGLMWLLARSSHCLSLTRHGTHEVRDLLRAVGETWVGRLRHDHFFLAATAHTTPGPVRELLTDVFASQRVFLAVGTVEPRKGYSVTLDACDMAWARGEQFVFVLLGAPGWRSTGLQDRIRRHSAFGRALFWIEDASDAELAWAYAKCRSLIQSSVAEGFGLPVVEALRHGAPVIASDLEVFDEIGGDCITTYRVGDPADLAAKLVDCLAAPRREVTLTLGDWSSSVRALAACLTDPQPVEMLPAQPRDASSVARIHVACCFDNGLAIPASVVAASVASTTTDAPVTFHMLHAPDLDIRIEDLAAALNSPMFDVVGHEISHDFSALHATSQYTSAAYYRFLIPDIIDTDRVIYLDCDTLVRRSLTELFELDLRGHPIAAAHDYSLTHHMRNHDFSMYYKGRSYSVDDYALEVLDLDLTHTSYFNSGVMVMDLAAWRRTGLAARCIETCDTYGVFNMVDQDVLNRVLQGDYERIDPRWNAMSYLHREYVPEPGALRPQIFGGNEENMRAPTGAWRDILAAWAFDPWIVHFTYRSKPWVPADRRTDYDDEFWRCARKTPYGRILRDRFG